MNTDNPTAQRHTTYKTIEENMPDLFWGQSVYDISPKRWQVQISGCSAQCWSHFGNPQSPLNQRTDYGLWWSRSPWINQMFVFVKLPIETETFGLNTWEIAEDYVFLVYARRMALLSVSFRQDNASAIATIWYPGYSKVPKSRRLFIGRLHVSIEEGEDALEELVQRNRCGDFLLNSGASGSLSWWSWWTWWFWWQWSRWSRPLNVSVLCPVSGWTTVLILWWWSDFQ